MEIKGEVEIQELDTSGESLKAMAMGDIEANVLYDQDPLNPREEFAEITTMVLNGGRNHNFACEVDKNIWGEASGYDELRELLLDRFHPLAIRPVYVYDHSGITLRLGANGDNPFTIDANWDTALVGFCMVTPEKYYEAFGEEPPSEDRLVSLMAAEVDEYSAYCSGEVYGYVLTNRSNGEDLDSCFGFYEFDDCVERAKEALREHAMPTVSL